jgi:hypothetical protein
MQLVTNLVHPFSAVRRSLIPAHRALGRALHVNGPHPGPCPSHFAAQSPGRPSGAPSHRGDRQTTSSGAPLLAAGRKEKKTVARERPVVSRRIAFARANENTRETRNQGRKDSYIKMGGGNVCSPPRSPAVPESPATEMPNLADLRIRPTLTDRLHREPRRRRSAPGTTRRPAPRPCRS